MRSLSLFDLPFLAQTAAAEDTADSFESYAASELLNGKDGGTGWAAAWVSRGGHLGLISEDNFESYTASASLNGKTGGTGWNAAWVSRTPTP